MLNLEKGNYMFQGCTKLESPLPELPSTLTDTRYMFRDCTSLIGVTPVKPSGLTYVTGTFVKTQLVNDGSWGSYAFNY